MITVFFNSVNKQCGIKAAQAWHKSRYSVLCDALKAIHCAMLQIGCREKHNDFQNSVRIWREADSRCLRT